MDKLPYLLLISLAVAYTQNENLITPAITSSTTTPGVNLTTTTTMPSSPNSTVHTTVISDLTDTTSFTSTTSTSETLSGTTAATAQSTSVVQTSQATSPRTNSTSLTSQTTAGYTSPAATAGITAANSSHTDNTTTASTDTTTRGLRLNFSDETMTIVFSAVLGLFALALVAFVFHRCKHKIQYLHQPLNDASDTADAFVVDDDTLVISGGLYDEHPIYDNVPTVPAEQPQFRLQFLH